MSSNNNKEVLKRITDFFNIVLVGKYVDEAMLKYINVDLWEKDFTNDVLDFLSECSPDESDNDLIDDLANAALPCWFNNFELGDNLTEAYEELDNFILDLVKFAREQQK